MFKNYFKVAIRNLRRNKLFSFLNILSLSVGIAVATLIIVYVFHELSYDKWISSSDEIYRVYRQYNKESERGSAITPTPLVNVLRNDISGVESTTRLMGGGELLVKFGQENYYVDQIAFVDEHFFQTIPLTFQYGNLANAKQRKSVVLSSAIAEQYFNNVNPIGESLIIDDTISFTIVGVLAAFEGPSHLNYNLFVIDELRETSWTGASGNTYLKINPKTDISNIEAGIYKAASTYIKAEYKEDGEVATEKDLPIWKLQALDQVHLQSKKLGETYASRGNPRRISIFISLALIILLLASINYINLTTAQASKRAKEVGLRKVTGATRQQMITQFLSESLIQSFIALLIAVVIAELSLPWFNQIINRPLELFQSGHLSIFLSLIVLTFAIGVLSGLYPAFYLSSFNPVSSLKGIWHTRKGKLSLRKGLVVFQFSLSISLIIVMVFIWQQVQFMLHKDLGFNKEQVLLVSINTDEGLARVEGRKQELSRLPGVKEVCQVARTPGRFIPNYGMNIEGQEEGTYVYTLFSDANLDGILGLKLKEGRFFSPEYARDSVESFVVNEAFVEAYGLDNPIGTSMKFSFDSTQSKIIGIVHDFHFQGLQNAIEPLAISTRESLAGRYTLALKLESDKIQEGIQSLSNSWTSIEPSHPIRYTFLDEDFAKQYETYTQFGQIVGYATFLSILIAFLGLFGLAIYTSEQRIKEVGIRKVFGATVNELVVLLMSSFLKLILIAALIALPIGYGFAYQWLQNFVYQIDLSLISFMLILLSVLTLAAITIGYFILKTAYSNPIKALRYE